MKFYYVYKTTNLINGKFYIGKHESYTENDEYLGSGMLLRKAIDKYGIDNFKKEIIEYCIDSSDLNKREKFWIDKEKSLTPVGYNIARGGEGGDTYTSNPNYDAIIEKLKTRRHTEESKLKISQNSWNTKNKGSLHFKFGTKWDEKQHATRINQIEERGGFFKGHTHSKESNERNRNAHLGKKQSDETLAKRSAAMSGKKQVIIVCPYCEKNGGISAMKRWHLDNCKLKNKLWKLQ